MKTIKKVLCVLMVLVMSLCVTTQAFAVDITAGSLTTTDDLESIISENFGYMLDSVLRRAEVYNISADDFDSFTILDPVSFNCTDDENNDSESIYHFPVADETGTIRLIFDVIFTENGYVTSIGTDFAPLLNAMYETNADTLVLVQDDYSFYALSGSTGYYQQGSSVADIAVSDFDDLSAYTIDSDTISVCSLTVNNEFSTLAENSYEKCIESAAELYSTAVTGTKSLTNYPIVDQNVDGKQYGLCWAATVASMVRFEKPSLYGNLTAQDVADYMKIDYDEGGTNSESKTALAHYLGGSYVPTIVNDVLTQQQIKTVIDNVDPAYLQCRRPNGFLSYKYHAVAMIGYDFTSNYTRIEIMDPAYECFKYCTMDSSEDWTFAFGSYTYTWIKTIRLLYST